MLNLSGKTALVTGASRGLGRGKGASQMKKMSALFSVIFFVVFATPFLAGGNKSNCSQLPDSTRKSLIQEFSKNPDLKNRPHFLNHMIRIINHKRKRLNVDERVARLLGGNGQCVIRADLEHLKRYFQSCSDDGLTMLRTMSIIASFVKQTNTLIYNDGRDVNRALKELNLSPGLALPVAHMRLFAFVPDPERAKKDEEFQCNIVAVYDKQYKHRFRKEVLPANLKIGTGDSATLVDVFSGDQDAWTGYMLKGIMTYSKDHVGFMEISGVGGEKWGFLGFLQKILFFLPDAIDAMTLDDKGDMTTIALINEKVKGFEKERKYQVHRIGELPWEHETPSLKEKK